MSDNMNNEKVKKKGNAIAVVLSVILVIVVFAFVGYVLVDREVINIEKEESLEKTTKESVELDINTKLVRSLYNSVSDEESNNTRGFWWYKENGGISDFYTASSSEVIKMKLVGKNLVGSKMKSIVNCSGLNIPDTVSSGHTSVCSYNNKYNENDAQTYYDKAYVENVYKMLYGSDAKLDTSVDIIMDFYGGKKYVYVAAKNAYYEYRIEGGGTSSGSYTSKLVRAVKEDSNIYLYEDVIEIINSNSQTLEYTFVYTFELDDDNMYTFVSRVKKDK